MDYDQFQIIEAKEILSIGKVEAPLPEWVKDPIYFSNDLGGNMIALDSYQMLNKRLCIALKRNKISGLFPVQSAVISKLLYSPLYINKHKMLRPRDICVKAPTGSGKTLAYALPVLQSLYLAKSLNNNSSIQALIILPTKNLASQVYEVFNQYGKELDIKVGLISGDQNVDTEKEKIIFSTPFNTNELCLNFSNESICSKVDIIVATPGRLIDHIHNTLGFNLNKLRFLVIDEADRVFQDVKQDWLFHLNRSMVSRCQDPYLPSWMEGRAMSLASQARGQFVRPPQKLLFSATFSFDPEKLAQINLFLPLMFEGRAGIQPNKGGDISSQIVADQLKISPSPKFLLPSTLEQTYVVCPTKADKPLYLLHLLTTSHKLDRVLCFTKSVESSHRLSRLLNFTGAFPQNPVSELNSRQKASSKRTLVRFNNSTKGTGTVLVCSDIMARGMDIDILHEENETTDDGDTDHGSLTVINYDCPSRAKSYVHRVGRTARAGRRGRALTIVETDQLPQFKSMFEQVGWDFDTTCVKVEFSAEKMNLVEALVAAYEKALRRLKQDSDTSQLGPTHRKRAKGKAKLMAKS